MDDTFDVVTSCYARRCHRETCCCKTPFVVRKNGVVIKDVWGKREGQEFINSEKLRQAH